MIYLDNAATSYKKPYSVNISMIKNTLSASANAGRGGHTLSIKTMEKVYDSAETIASLFGIANPENIVFTQNATLALNIAISGILSKGGHAVTTAMEHNSVLRPINHHANYTIVPANKSGFVCASDVEAAIRDDTKLIVCTHISNVCGAIEPIKEISKVAKKYCIPFLVDASQSAGNVPIDISEFGIDLLACSGHKGLLAPLGTGMLYVSPRLKLNPLIFGGTGSNSESLTQPSFMPDRLQTGTLNAPAIISFGKACEYIKRITPHTIHEHELNLALKFIEDINEIKGAAVYGPTFSKKRNGTVAFNLKNLPPTAVSDFLDKEYKIAVRSGFHCAPLAHKALDTGNLGCVRASFGYFNSVSDEKKLISALNKLSRI